MGQPTLMNAKNKKSDFSLLKQIVYFVSFVLILLFVSKEGLSERHAHYNLLDNYTLEQQEELIDWVNTYCHTSHTTWASLLLDTKLQCRVGYLDQVHQDFYNLPGIRNELKVTYDTGRSETRLKVFCLVCLILWILMYFMERKTVRAFLNEKSSKYFIFLYVSVIVFSIYDSTLNDIIRNTTLFTVLVFLFAFSKFFVQALNNDEHFRWLGGIAYIISSIFLISLASLIVTRAIPEMLIPDLSKYLIKHYDIDSFPAKIGIDLLSASDHHNTTLVNQAVLTGSLDAVKYLVETKGIDPNISALYERTSLDLALKYKAYTIANYLILHTPEYDSYYQGHTPLPTASKSLNLEFLKKVAGTRFFDLKEVHYSVREAIRYNDINALNFLLEHFALTTEDVRVYQLLEYAYQEHNPNAYTMLEKHFNIKDTNYCQDNQCKDILKRSLKHNDDKMTDYLISKGANVERK